MTAHLLLTEKLVNQLELSLEERQLHCRRKQQDLQNKYSHPDYNRRSGNDRRIKNTSRP